jgi:outer membrane receptor protein involved in Fe transport
MQGILTASGQPIPADKWMDGRSGNASLTMGGNFAGDKGNAVVSFRYYKSKALLQSERDYSACPIGFPQESTTPFCAGTSANATGTFQDRRYFAADPTVDGPDRIDPGPRLTLDSVTGQIRRFTARDAYNFAPTNYYQRPQERYQASAFAHYDITPAARVYAQFGFHDDSSVAQIAPTAAFFVDTPVRWENPLLTDEWRSRFLFRNPETGAFATGPGTIANVQVNRRNVDGGPRQSELGHSSFREVVGLKGSAGASWEYDVYIQDSRVRYQERFLHDFSRTRIARAFDVVSDPVTGAPVCASVLNGVDRNCVPWNVWALNGITPEALAYVEVSPQARATMSQRIVGGTATANLGDYGVQLPRTRDAVEFAIGFERRTEKLDFEVSQEYSDLAGNSTPPKSLAGGLTVREVFTELRVPALDVANVTGSYRISDYDSGFRTHSYGVGVNASLFKGARLRGSYQRAVRAPNLNELFTPQLADGYELGPGLDPCAGGSPIRSLSDCQRTGVTASQYGRIVQAPDDAFPATGGGNPELKPETARTYTAGIVLAPFKDFTATMDYFDIRIEDTISGISGDTLFTQCIDTGNPVFCRHVQRDRSGALWYGTANVVAINQNIGKTRLAGVDLALTYTWRMPQGHGLLFDGLGSYLDKYTIEPYPQAPTAICVGRFLTECATMPFPRWKHRLRVTWQPPSSFELAATWRYIGSTSVAEDIPGLPVTFKIPPMNYLDLAATWSITKRITLRGGIGNATDRDPPVIVSGAGPVNGNTFAQLYDALGRHYFVGLSVQF